MKLTHRLALVALVVGMVGCDHATKHIAQSELRGGEDISLVSGVLELTYTENRGVGFNLLRAVPDEIRQPLLRVTGLLVVVMLLVAWTLRRREALYEQAAFALLLAGGLGNQIDRFARGFVIDFIHLQHWPIFNVADICLVAGMILLGLRLWRERGPSPTPQPG